MQFVICLRWLPTALVFVYEKKNFLCSLQQWKIKNSILEWKTGEKCSYILYLYINGTMQRKFFTIKEFCIRHGKRKFNYEAFSSYIFVIIFFLHVVFFLERIHSTSFLNITHSFILYIHTLLIIIFITC